MKPGERKRGGINSRGGKSRRGGRPGARKGFGARLLQAGLVAMVIGVVALAGYLLYLDRLITETFEGRRWTVSALVYAQPLELFPGAALTLADVVGELNRNGYEQLANPVHPGSYQRRNSELLVHLRAFDFLEGGRPSQRIRLSFGGGGLAQIADSSGRPVPLIRLDPLSVGSFFPSHGEDRQILPPEAVPDLLESGLKAVEDERFDSHLGFDLTGIARAAWINLTAGEIRQGGSTLTQQLVKSYFLDNRQTFVRKLREVLMAVILELRFSKEELLNAYINEVFLGQDGARAVHGFGLGAQFYFNRPLTELQPHELATLITIIRGPSYYNPYRHPSRVLERRDRVLGILHTAGLISADVLQDSQAKPLGIVSGARSGGAYYPAFLDMVRRSLAETYADEDLTTAGLRVFTTLSPRSQDATEQALADTLSRLETGYKLPAGELQSAVVIASTQTGEIEAIAGGRTAGRDGFNRALNARRHIGSLIKPVVYLAALERGYHLASILQDAPVSLPMRGQEPWTPRNFDGEVYGPVPLVRALGDSLNLATVNLGLAIGVDQVSDRLHSLTGRRPKNQFPSLLLGAEDMTPVEVLELYGPFAGNGFHVRPKSVVAVMDESGVPLTQQRFELEQKIDPENAAAINRALEIVMQDGTGKSSRFARLGVAGKTGTSDDYRDSWFVGYDASRIAVVWLGYDDNRASRLTGATGALQVWDSIFSRLGVSSPAVGYPEDWVDIEYATGLLANEDCAEVVRVPLPESVDRDRDLQAKAGCGITLRRFGEGIRRNLREWFN
ncbi:MAG: transglycosylase domain-containing protein [Pseudomonadales bacterium]